MSCFICRGEEPVLYKLCDQCLESTICVDCYNIDNINNMDKCSICRKKYKYDYNRDYKGCFNILSRYILLFCLALIIELFTPLALFFNTYNYVFLGYSLFCIIIVNILLYYFITKSTLSQKIIDFIFFTKLAGISLINIIIYITNDVSVSQTMNIYSYVVFGLFYILPLFLICCKLCLSAINRKWIELNNKTRKKHIHVYQILYKDNLV